MLLALPSWDQPEGVVLGRSWGLKTDGSLFPGFKEDVMETITLPYIEIRQEKRCFILTKMPAGILVRISYAAVRRVDEEEGAVQRILNIRPLLALRLSP